VGATLLIAVATCTVGQMRVRDPRAVMTALNSQETGIRLRLQHCNILLSKLDILVLRI